MQVVRLRSWLCARLFFFTVTQSVKNSWIVCFEAARGFEIDKPGLERLRDDLHVVRRNVAEDDAIFMHAADCPNDVF